MLFINADNIRILPLNWAKVAMVILIRHTLHFVSLYFKLLWMNVWNNHTVHMVLAESGNQKSVYILYI